MKPDPPKPFACSCAWTADHPHPPTPCPANFPTNRQANKLASWQALPLPTASPPPPCARISSRGGTAHPPVAVTALCYHCTMQSPRPCSPPPNHPHPAITHQQGITRRSAAKRPRPCSTSSPLPVRSPYPAGKPPPPSAHTPPSLQVSNFPTSQQVEKLESRKVGKLAHATNHQGRGARVSWSVHHTPTQASHPRSPHFLQLAAFSYPGVNHCPRRHLCDPSACARQLPNKSTNRKAGKLASRKVGKRTTNHTPPGSSPLVSWPRPPHPVSAPRPAPAPFLSHPAGNPPRPALAPAGEHHPSARLTRRVDQTKGLPRLTPSKMYNAIVSGRYPAQTAPVPPPQAIKESVRSLQRQHVP